MRCCIAANRPGARERPVGGTRVLEVASCLDRGVAELVQRGALLFVRLDRVLECIDRQAADQDGSNRRRTVARDLSARGFANLSMNLQFDGA